MNPYVASDNSYIEKSCFMSLAGSMLMVNDVSWLMDGDHLGDEDADCVVIDQSHETHLPNQTHSHTQLLLESVHSKKTSLSIDFQWRARFS